jgi:hypothetical protein
LPYTEYFFIWLNTSEVVKWILNMSNFGMRCNTYTKYKKHKKIVTNTAAIVSLQLPAAAACACGFGGN